MNYRKIIKPKLENFPKRFRFRDKKHHVVHNLVYRLGDEIFNTALIRYLKENKNYCFHYSKNCYAIDSEKYFIDGLVQFESSPYTYAGIEEFHPFSLWLWNEMLQDKGYYCEIKDKYDSSKADLDIVFFPMIAPEYNPNRDLKKECVSKIFFELLKCFPNTLMVIDKNKRQHFDLSSKNCFYSPNLKESFDLIKRSKVFIGCDTGVSHYAGSLNHPRMVFLYPDYKKIGVDFLPEYIHLKRNIVKKFNVPEIYNYRFSTLPCCNKNNYRVVDIENNSVNTDDLIYKIHEIGNAVLS